MQKIKIKWWVSAMIEKVEHVQFFNLIFWLWKIYSNYETLFSKTATFTENDTSLNKQLL